MSLGATARILLRRPTFVTPKPMESRRPIQHELVPNYRVVVSGEHAADPSPTQQIARTAGTISALARVSVPGLLPRAISLAAQPGRGKYYPW